MFTCNFGPQQFSKVSSKHVSKRFKSLEISVFRFASHLWRYSQRKWGLSETRELFANVAQWPTQRLEIAATLSNLLDKRWYSHLNPPLDTVQIFVPGLCSSRFINSLTFVMSKAFYLTTRWECCIENHLVCHLNGKWLTFELGAFFRD